MKKTMLFASILGFAIIGKAAANSGTIAVGAWSPTSTVTIILPATDNQRIYVNQSNGNTFEFSLNTSADEAMFAVLNTAISKGFLIQFRYSSTTPVDGPYYPVDRIQLLNH